MKVHQANAQGCYNKSLNRCWERGEEFCLPDLNNMSAILFVKHWVRNGLGFIITVPVLT